MATTMNKAQQRSLKNLYDRWLADLAPSSPANNRGYLAFRRRAKYAGFMECWMIPLWGMHIGIEKDGYTHS